MVHNKPRGQWPETFIDGRAKTEVEDGEWTMTTLQNSSSHAFTLHVECDPVPVIDTGGPCEQVG